MGVWCVWVWIHVWRSKDNFQESVFFYLVEASAPLLCLLLCRLAGLAGSSPVFASHLTIAVLRSQVCTIMLVLCVMLEVETKASCRLSKHSTKEITSSACSFHLMSSTFIHVTQMARFPLLNWMKSIHCVCIVFSLSFYWLTNTWIYSVSWLFLIMLQ